MKKIKLKHLVISLLLLCVVILSASAAFATSDDVALTGASDEIAIDNDILTAVDEIPVEENALAESSGDEILTEENVVTNGNFFNYFDDTGTLLDNVNSTELIFEGDFSELGISYITIGQPITFTGHNAVFDGVTFVVMSDDVTIDGFTITQYADIYAVNIYGGSNIVLSNNIIDYAALEGFESYGIYSFATSDLSLINNTIIFVGNTDGTVVNNAVRIEGDDENENPCTDIVVQGNTFDITIPSCNVGYDEDTWESVVYSEGIVFYYCEDLEFVDNRVDIRYNDFIGTSGYDSIYGVGVRSDAYSFGEIQSSNIVIADNNISVEGYSCAYPIYVCADNFNVSGNTIISTADSYLAHGIDVEGPSSNGIVADNDITAEAPLAAYGIYSYQWMGAIEDIAYYNNIISVAAYGSAGMEVVECNPIIAGNTITADGNYTYGIIASCRDEGNIEGNTINSLGSNVGSDVTGDPLMPKNSMGISVKGASEIEDNTVYSTNIGLNFVEEGGTVVDGNTITVENNALIGSYGIYAKSVDDLTFTDNIITYVGYSNGTVVNNAVRIEGDDKNNVPVKDITFDGNTFDITIPSCDVEYDMTTYEPTVYSEGIIFYYIEDLEFVNNNVEVRYNDVTGAYGYDSLYAVSVKGNPYIYDFDDDYELVYPVVSKNVVIADNNISIDGHACAYAVWAGAENLTVSGNDIYSSSETYLAHGIDIDSNAADVMVSGNTVVAEAPLATYGICADGYMGPVTNSQYVNNTVTVTGYSSIGMKVVVDPNPVIAENTVVAEGNYTYGIIANNGVVEGNDVSALGSNVGSDPTGDSYMQKNSVGISVKATDVVNNTVYSTNTGLNIVQEGGINVEGNTITVENNALIGSYGIYAKSVDDLTFTDNIITYVGYSNGTVVNNAVRIEGDDKNNVPVKDITFDGNTFDITIPSCDVEYDMTTYEPTVYSEGIIFYYIEDLEFVNNNVEVRYNDVTGAYGYDSIYAVSVKGNPYIYTFDDDYELVYPVVSKNVLIADNNISIDGHACVYAVWAGAENLTVSGNDIYSSSETYLAHGIDIDSNAADVMVADNTVVAEAPLATYGICADGYMGPVTDSQYVNNTVTVTGYSSIGMKVVVDPNPVIADNGVNAYGNYTYGIIANNGIVSGNEVSVFGSNVGSDPTGDSYMQKNSVGISVKSTDVVNNTVYSTNTGLNIVQKGDMIVDGNIIEVLANTGEISNHAIVATKIDNLTISNNNIIYMGASSPKENYTTAKAYAVYMTNSTVEIADNTLEIIVPSLPADWEETPPGSWNYVRHAYTEGIVFDGCDDSSLIGNDITLTYNGGSYGSIYVVDVLDSDNFSIEDNTIVATGENYLYGIILQGDNFVIYNNTINATSDYYACGIDIEGPSTGTIDSNTIVATASEDAYPIYAGMNGQPVSCEIINNDIYGNAYYGVGIELGGQDATINNNTIELEGNYTIGIGASVDNLIANGNTIVSRASNVGDISIWDSMGTDTVGIKSKNGNVNITENNVSSTGTYAVDIADCDGTVNGNNLTAKKLKGDRSVYSIGSATVYNNGPSLNTILSAENVTVAYLEDDKLVATLTNAEGKPLVTANVVINIDGVDYALKTNSKGQAKLSTSNLTMGNYTATISYAGNPKYNPATATANVVVGKGNVAISAPNVSVVYRDETGALVVTLTNAKGDAIDDAEIVVSLNGESNTLVTDSNGQANVSTKGLTTGKYTATISYAGDETYNPSDATAKVVVTKADIVLSVPDVSVVYRDETGGLVATLTNAEGKALVSTNVVITLNGVDYALKTNSKGQVKVSTSNLTTGTYVATVSYAGNNKYNPATTTANVVVTKASTVLSSNDISLGEDLVATLTNEYGKVLNSANVVVKIGNETFKLKTNSKGQVKVSTSGLAPGDYTAIISYAGNAKYLGTSTTANIIGREQS